MSLDEIRNNQGKTVNLKQFFNNSENQKYSGDLLSRVDIDTIHEIDKKTKVIKCSKIDQCGKFYHIYCYSKSKMLPPREGDVRSSCEAFQKSHLEGCKDCPIAYDPAYESRRLEKEKQREQEKHRYFYEKMKAEEQQRQEEIRRRSIEILPEKQSGEEFSQEPHKREFYIEKYSKSQSRPSQGASEENLMNENKNYGRSGYRIGYEGSHQELYDQYKQSKDHSQSYQENRIEIPAQQESDEKLIEVDMRVGEYNLEIKAPNESASNENGMSESLP